MFLSNPGHYLLSFFNIIEILVECSATRSGLKQLKTITVVQSPRKPRRRERKYDMGDNGDIDMAGMDEKSTSSHLPHEFVFILKLWTLYAFVALYSRHIEPLFKYIPGYYVWNTGEMI